jgi:hypothetical protein
MQLNKWFQDSKLTIPVLNLQIQTLMLTIANQLQKCKEDGLSTTTEDPQLHDVTNALDTVTLPINALANPDFLDREHPQLIRTEVASIALKSLTETTTPKLIRSTLTVTIRFIEFESTMILF